MIKTTEIKTILLEASEIISKYFNLETVVTFKEDKSPVTVADYAVNEFLKNRLLTLMPQAGWLSEEEKDNFERLSKEYVWIVDPLDGTKEFVARIPEIAISIALVKENKPVLGGVINPITKEGGICSHWDGMYFFGFEPNLKKTSLENASIIVSRTEYSQGKIKPFQNHLKNIKAVGSVAYKLLRVSGGIDDFYFSVEPKSEWDICGGIALLNSAGKGYQRFDNKKNLFNCQDIRIQTGAAAGEKVLIHEFIKKFPEAANHL